MILGVVLFGAEIVAIDAQFYLVFLGLSAVAVGLLALAGIVMPEWVEWLVFASLSLISMFSFRRSLYEKIRGDVPGFKEGLEGEFIVVPSDLAAGAQGRASLRGADWTIVNGGTSAITAGSRVKVVRNEGLTLYVSADQN
jgi:hypothetical protein